MLSILALSHHNLPMQYSYYKEPIPHSAPSPYDHDRLLSWSLSRLPRHAQSCLRSQRQQTYYPMTTRRGQVHQNASDIKNSSTTKCLPYMRCLVQTTRGNKCLIGCPSTPLSSSECLLYICMRSPVKAFHTWTVWSLQPEARYIPSGDQATSHT